MSQFTQQIHKPTQVAGEDTNPWFWNPNRIGVQLAPEWFRRKLHEIDNELEVTWDRHNERWLVWVKKPRLQTRLCQGWLLLFPVHDGKGGFVPLDERTLAKVYEISARQWGDGKRYFEAVARERERDAERVDKTIAEDDKYRSYEYFDFTKPKVGYGSQVSSSKMVGQ
jgi:hypothetical protein